MNDLYIPSHSGLFTMIKYYLVVIQCLKLYTNDNLIKLYLPFFNCPPVASYLLTGGNGHSQPCQQVQYQEDDLKPIVQCDCEWICIGLLSYTFNTAGL